MVGASPDIAARLRGALSAGAVAAAIAHGLRMAVNLVVIKLIAVAIGPAGLGAIGNLLSVLSVVMVFAGGGIANGIVKYVAEHRGRTPSALRFVEAALALGIGASALVLLACCLAARPMALFLFGNGSLWWLSIALGITHFFCFIGTAVIAIANGSDRSDVFAGISIVAYLGTIPVAYALVAALGFSGAALALMCMAASTGLPAGWILLRSPLRRLLRIRFRRPETLLLLRFSAMTLVSAVSFPVTEILIRQAIVPRLGLDDAGLWQAALRLSGAILGFYTVFLATSYMPRLSSEPDPRVAQRIVLRSIVRVGFVFAVIALLVYGARSIVVPLLFSPEFAALEGVLAWQLLGDLMRVCAYVIGFLVIARAHLSLHIGAEVLQYAIYGGITLSVLAAGGDLTAVVQAYAASYAIYFLVGLIWLGIAGKRLR